MAKLDLLSAAKPMCELAKAFVMSSICDTYLTPKNVSLILLEMEASSNAFKGFLGLSYL